MIGSDKPIGKPNEAIFLDDITITHIEDRRLSEPCSARVFVDLSPTVDCRMYSEDLPRSLASQLNRTFTITTGNGVKTKVILQYQLNDLMRRSETFRGILFPHESPCTAIPSDTQIRSLTFGVLNFRPFYGDNDRWIEIDGQSCRLGTADLQHDGMCIELVEHSGFSENRKLLQEENGFAVTHEGIISRRDGVLFAVEDVQLVLRGLRAFLSFARGSACGLTLVRGIDAEGCEVVIEWGTTHTDPWRQGSDSWLPTNDGGDCLSGLFPGFWNLHVAPEWRDTIRIAIDWYLNSKNSAFHVGIILVQAALEKLCHKVFRPKRSREGTGQYLSESLRQFGIEARIPASCSHLRELFANVPSIGEDGLKATTEIRNDLVHATPKYGVISPEAQMDALRLGQWYIEVVLLKLFNYTGRYRNRVSVTSADPFEYVPWDSAGLIASTMA